MNAPSAISDREVSDLALLGSLVREVWPQVVNLPQDQFDLIPEPVRQILATFWGDGTRDRLPHEVEIDDARSRAEWAESIQRSQAKVLDRLAEHADRIYAERGGKKVIHYNIFGYPIRDYGADLDAVLDFSVA